ncbi:MAG: hypothetical protein ACTHJ3_00690 [Pararhizobium sp.]
MPYLVLAYRHWKNGEPIPVDLHIRLTDLGYDVASLEARYSN